MWTHLLLCLSLANLVFLRSWQELFRLRLEMPEDLRSGPVQALFAGTVMNVLILGLVLWMGILLVDRIRSRTLLITAQCAFLLLLITPLDFLCRDAYTHLRAELPDPLMRGVWTAIIMVPVVGCLLLVGFRNPAILRASRAVVLIVTPLLPLAMANVAWSIYRAPANPQQPVLAEALPGQPEHRVLWLVFDEMDQRIAFDVRPDDIQLPELDRLRSQSLFATHAKPPSMYTLESLPSLITGQTIARTLWDNGGLRLEMAGGESRPFNSTGTIFADARAAGFNTALTGWWLPYCKSLADSLNSCAVPAVDDMRPANVYGSMQDQLRDHLDLFWVRRRLREENHWTIRLDLFKTHSVVHKEAFGMITDPTAGLVLIHWPIPHPLGIYDRHSDDFGFARNNNYIDNYELVDRVLGEIRQSLTRSGLWDRTTILVTSDHPLRPDEWNQHATWTEEESRLSQERRFPFIPFLLKLSGQDAAIEYDQEFNTIVTKDLLLEILHGRLDSLPEVAGWLSSRASS